MYLKNHKNIQFLLLVEIFPFVAFKHLLSQATSLTFKALLHTQIIDISILSRGAALILVFCRGSDIGILSRGAALILAFCRGERL